MRKYSWLLSLVMVFALLRPAFAAPMFPDVPDMWAKDAVAQLAAKGILEGYPDGTFKGDRAATRYEVAMIVARLLSKMEQEMATFATKADLDDLRKLVNQLREELDALGVRVQNLEDNVAKLDKRVTELERITFYGSLDARFVSQRMGNDGNAVGINGTGAGTNPALAGLGFTSAIGTVGIAGTTTLPIFVNGAGNIVQIGGTAPTGTIGTTLANVVLGTGVAVGNLGTVGAGNLNPAVGIPMLFNPNTGRPIAVREFAWNAANFNTPNSGTTDPLGTASTQGTGVFRPNYNIVAGSTRSLGGSSPNDTVGIATGGGSLFTGLTGRAGQLWAAPAVLPAFEVRNGRPWTNGTGWSGEGILGVRIKLNEDMDAGMELAAFYTTGDSIVDQFYGVSAHRLANAFAGNQGLGPTGGTIASGQYGDNSPYTRMNIDNFWFVHKPTGIKVQLGAYGDTNMDSIVYTPEYNPNLFGPRYLDNYGFRVSGSGHLLAKFDWELFGSNVGDGNRVAPEA
ncbi:MAG: hypothetical protein FJX76_27810, partial [Armatimonadetes bacterium]|nr:hypothetical protein [Armatimonadota bacterium]